MKAARDVIRKRIVKGIKRCASSVLVMDEVDLMPPGIMSVLSPVIQQQPIDDLPTSRLFVIWTSNIGESLDKMTNENMYALRAACADA